MQCDCVRVQIDLEVDPMGTVDVERNVHRLDLEGSFEQCCACAVACMLNLLRFLPEEGPSNPRI